MDVEAEIGERTDRWQLTIEARDPEAAARFLSGDYALVILQPPPAVVRREEWLRMLPDYDVRGYVVEERIVESAPDLCTVFQRLRPRRAAARRPGHREASRTRTTAADVSAFWQALFAGKIVSTEWVAELVEPRRDGAHDGHRVRVTRSARRRHLHGDLTTRTS